MLVLWFIAATCALSRVHTTLLCFQAYISAITYSYFTDSGTYTTPCNKTLYTLSIYSWMPSASWCEHEALGRIPLLAGTLECRQRLKQSSRPLGPEPWWHQEFDNRRPREAGAQLHTQVDCKIKLSAVEGSIHLQVNWLIKSIRLIAWSCWLQQQFYGKVILMAAGQSQHINGSRLRATYEQQ